MVVVCSTKANPHRYQCEILDSRCKWGYNKYKHGAGINPTDVTLPLGSRAALSTPMLCACVWLAR